MNYTSFYFVFVAIVMMIASISAQDYFLNSFPSAPNALFGQLAQQQQIQRDPRQNRGPVVFPPAPPSSDETSGVIVGASGYGFVPPGAQGVGPVGRPARYF
ncbi:uncharacterized protein LOC123302650 [Chrysoperla carnea]|uniref:uncharacterized protein LOC123302650 n=1 Tax=Chrysoperla carnea TaxID=189513 RepID=UPI001D0643F0|nr:uncharacterized protein LOC123302650 [Chrysoperla carnea]